MRAESPARRRLGRSLVAADSYGLVLSLVVVTYVVSVSVTQAWAGSVVLTVQLATVWLTLRTAHARRGVRLLADVVLCAAAVVAVVSFFAHDTSDQQGGIFIVCCLLYLIAPFTIVRHLILRREIDAQALLGAIAAYLLIGMFFAFAYKAAGELGSVPFFGTAGSGSLSQDLFFSFVTIATVGYGNLVPAANPGQTLAVLEAVVGQLFLIVAVGKIISNLRPRWVRDPAPQPPGPADQQDEQAPVGDGVPGSGDESTEQEEAHCERPGSADRVRGAQFGLDAKRPGAC